MSEEKKTKAKKPALKVFSFPETGTVIRAKSRAEAEKLFKEQQVKEADND